jgi:hypothetical protein
VWEECEQHTFEEGRGKVRRGVGLGEGTHDHLKELTKAHMGMGDVTSMIT